MIPRGLQTLLGIIACPLDKRKAHNMIRRSVYAAL